MDKTPRCKLKRKLRRYDDKIVATPDRQQVAPELGKGQNLLIDPKTYDMCGAFNAYRHSLFQPREGDTHEQHKANYWTDLAEFYLFLTLNTDTKGNFLHVRLNDAHPDASNLRYFFIPAVTQGGHECFFHVTVIWEPGVMCNGRRLVHHLEIDLQESRMSIFNDAVPLQVVEDTSETELHTVENLDMDKLQDLMSTDEQFSEAFLNFGTESSTE